MAKSKRKSKESPIVVKWANGVVNPQLDSDNLDPRLINALAVMFIAAAKEKMAEKKK